jgi:hypothetical protein
MGAVEGSTLPSAFMQTAVTLDVPAELAKDTFNCITEKTITSSNRAPKVFVIVIFNRHPHFFL